MPDPLDNLATFDASNPLDALGICATVFRAYEVHHRNKVADHSLVSATETLAKANRNAQLAAMCERIMRDGEKDADPTRPEPGEKPLPYDAAYDDINRRAHALGMAIDTLRPDNRGPIITALAGQYYAFMRGGVTTGPDETTSALSPADMEEIATALAGAIGVLGNIANLGEALTILARVSTFAAGYNIEELAKISEEGRIPEPATLSDAIARTINRFNGENASNTPDHLLAHFITHSLDAFNSTVNQRESWYGREPGAFYPCDLSHNTHGSPTKAALDEAYQRGYNDARPLDPERIYLKETEPMPDSPAPGGPNGEQPRTYIGLKAVEAWPCPELDAHRQPFPGGRDGYRVRYADGYESWSPKEAFEEAYYPVPEGEAPGILEAMRAYQAAVTGNNIVGDCLPLEFSDGRVTPLYQLSGRALQDIRLALRQCDTASGDVGLQHINDAIRDRNGGVPQGAREVSGAAMAPKTDAYTVGKGFTGEDGQPLRPQTEPLREGQAIQDYPEAN